MQTDWLLAPVNQSCVFLEAATPSQLGVLSQLQCVLICSSPTHAWPVGCRWMRATLQTRLTPDTPCPLMRWVCAFWRVLCGHYLGSWIDFGGCCRDAVRLLAPDWCHAAVCVMCPTFPLPCRINHFSPLTRCMGRVPALSMAKTTRQRGKTNLLLRPGTCECYPSLSSSQPRCV